MKCWKPRFVRRAPQEPKGACSQTCLTSMSLMALHYSSDNDLISNSIVLIMSEA